jgi:hypothetical protein
MFFWALHLTGVGFPPPRAVLGRDLQTGRVPSSAWRLRWHCPWTLGGHEVLVSNRCMDDRKFQDTVEKHPSTAGVTTIEPEDELVEVAWQVGRIHGALVGTKYPTLGQGGDPVHRRQ